MGLGRAPTAGGPAGGETGRLLLGSKTKLTWRKELGRLVVRTSYSIIRINVCYEEVKLSFIDRQITW